MKTMLKSYILSIVLFVESLLNLIIYRKKINIIKFIFGLLLSSIIFLFIYVPSLKEYLMYYELSELTLIIVYALIFIPKKITKNLTEYDYFELEKNYNELKEDREVLRERFLSTIDLIEEGIIFYENNGKDVILSNYPLTLFGGMPKRSFSEHKNVVYSLDRPQYEKVIDKAISKGGTYEIKYRLESKKESWIIEKGNVIRAGKVTTMISTVRPLSVSLFKKSTFFDLDAIPYETELFGKIKENLTLNKSFVLIQMELTNIKDINEKYSRDIGSIMMCEYIKHFKNHYLDNINSFYRHSGIRFFAIIEDLKNYKAFHDDLINPKSELYNYMTSIGNSKEAVNPNFSVINVTSSTRSSSLELVKLSTQLLTESIESKRRNYTIINN